jgi:tetratricopeptide (TPR) repeat protein
LKIFISYSRRDAGDLAESLRDDLINGYGYDVFTDVKNIEEGDTWSKTIEENIKTCDIFIIIITRSSLMSLEVEKEVLLAQDGHKKIIPCIWKEIDLKEIKWGLDKIQGPIFVDKYDLVRKIKIKNNRKEFPIIRPESLVNNFPQFDKIIPHKIYNEKLIFKIKKNIEEISTERIEKISNMVVDKSTLLINKLPNPIKHSKNKPVEIMNIPQEVLSPNLPTLPLFLLNMIKDSSTLGLLPINDSFFFLNESVYHTINYICKRGKLRLSGSADGQFDQPAGIAVDPVSGYVYVADKDNNRIQKFDTAGRFLIKWGSKGSADGQFDQPAGIAVDPVSGYVYVADKDNNRIQKFDTAGRFLIKWGSKGSADGQLDRPISIAIGYDVGRVFICDHDDHIVILSLSIINENIKKGKYFSHLKEYDKALNCMEKALDLDSRNVYAWINKGVLISTHGEFYEGIEYFDKALDLDSRNVYAWINKGTILYSLKEYDKALNCLGNAADIDPDIDLIWVNNGNCLLYTQRYKEALENYDKALEINQKNLVALMNKSVIHYLSNEFDQSILNLNKLLRIDHDFLEGYLLRGCSKIKKGNLEQGQKDLSIASSLDKEKTICILKEDQDLIRYLSSDDEVKKFNDLNITEDNLKSIRRSPF